MPSQIDLKRFLPLILIVLIYIAWLGNGFRNWLTGMVDSSYRTTGQYEKYLSIPPAPVQLPRDSYVCNPSQKLPWIGCSIR